MDALHISENSSGNDCKDVTVVKVYTVYMRVVGFGYKKSLDNLLPTSAPAKQFLFLVEGLRVLKC